MESFEPAFHRTRSQYGESPYEPSDTLEILCSEVLNLEQIAKHLSRAFRDDHCSSATPCKRVATFGVSPTTACSCAEPDPSRSPATTSPVAIPTRVWRVACVFRSLTSATNSNPACTARSASCSCASG